MYFQELNTPANIFLFSVPIITSKGKQWSKMENYFKTEDYLSSLPKYRRKFYYYGKELDITSKTKIVYLDFIRNGRRIKYEIIEKNLEEIEEIKNRNTGKLLINYPHIVAINYTPNDFEKQLAKILLPELWSWRISRIRQQQIFLGAYIEKGHLIIPKKYHFSVNNQDDIDAYMNRVGSVLMYYRMKDIGHKMVTTVKNISHMPKSYRMRVIDFFKEHTMRFINWSASKMGLMKLLKFAGMVTLIIACLHLKYNYNLISNPSFPYNDFSSWLQSYSFNPKEIVNFLKPIFGAITMSDNVFKVSLMMAKNLSNYIPTYQQILVSLKW